MQRLPLMLATLDNLDWGQLRRMQQPCGTNASKTCFGLLCAHSHACSMLPTLLAVCFMRQELPVEPRRQNCDG